MSDKPTPSHRNATQKELGLLNHVHSLGIVRESDIGPTEISALLQSGWIRKVWIGNYALTDAGKRARWQSPTVAS